MRQVLKLPAYRRLLAAYTLTQLAWWLGTLGLAVLVYRRTGSALGSAAFFLCAASLFPGSSLVLEFVALVVLRVREPRLPRPFRVPGGLVGAVALGIGPLAMLVFALIKNAGERLGRVNALVFALGVILAGPVVHAVARRR